MSAVRAYGSPAGTPEESSKTRTGEPTQGVIALADGTAMSVRAVRPGDAAALQRLHDRLSERSIELRFFGPLEELSDEMANNLSRAPDEDRLALVALEPDGGSDGGEEIVAVVCYAREASTERAEYAALIEDRWQGLGLGGALTERLIGAARERGIRRLYALVTPENAPMLGLLRDLEVPTRTGQEDGATRVELDLSQDGTAEDT